MTFIDSIELIDLFREVTKIPRPLLRLRANLALKVLTAFPVSENGCLRFRLVAEKRRTAIPVDYRAITEFSEDTGECRRLTDGVSRF